MTPFWWPWPSWVVEILSGLALATAVQFVDGLVTQALAAFVASLVYESFLDVNAFSWRDVGQRAVGSLLGLMAWALIR